MHNANEGKVACVVAPETADLALDCLHGHPLGREAAVIGEVTAAPAGEVLMRSALGVVRVLDEPSGASLPRIC